MYKVCPLCRTIYYKAKFESVNRFKNEHKYCSRKCWYKFAKENKIGFFGHKHTEDISEKFYLIDERVTEMYKMDDYV